MHRCSLQFDKDYNNNNSRVGSSQTEKSRSKEKKNEKGQERSEE